MWHLEGNASGIRPVGFSTSNVTRTANNNRLVYDDNGDPENGDPTAYRCLIGTVDDLPSVCDPAAHVQHRPSAMNALGSLENAGIPIEYTGEYRHGGSGGGGRREKGNYI